MRCYFCKRDDFTSFDDVQFHIVSINVNGLPQCPKMSSADIKRFDEWYSKYDRKN